MWRGSIHSLSRLTVSPLPAPSTAITVQHSGARPVMVGLQQYFGRTNQWGEIMAYATVITLPVLLASEQETAAHEDVLKQLDKARFVTPDFRELPDDWRGSQPQKAARKAL